jgi:lysophospholipase L1-like esterase
MSRISGGFLAALLCTTAISAVAAPPAIPPSAPLNSSSPITIGGAKTTLGQAIGASASQVWRNTATRVNYPNLANSDGYKPTNTARLYYPLANRGQIAALRVCYANFGYNGAQAYESNATYPVTVTSSIELNTLTPASTWFPGGAGATHQVHFTFNGADIASLPVTGAPVCSDPFYYPFVSPQSVYIWTYVNSNAGVSPGSWVVNHGTRNAYKEMTNNGYVGSNTSSLSSNTTLTWTVAPLSITGPGLTGAATGTCSGGTATLTGTGLSSGSVVCATGVVTLTFGSAQAGVYTYSMYGTTAAADETLTFGPGDMTQAYAPVFGPVSVEALLSPSSTKFPFSILAVGDSIITGIGNTDTSLSFLDYSVQSTIGDFTTATIGIEKISQPSETLGNFLLNNYRRMKLAGSRFDEIVSNYGTNDLAGSPTLLTMQTNYLALWSFLAQFTPHGYKDVYQTSILPRTVSNVSQTPLNANYASGSSLRNQMNAWMCSQVGVTIGGFIDTSAAVENSPGSCAGTGDGQWKSLSLTADGTHPTNAGHTAIAGVVGVAGTNPSPAFVGH